jgi:dsDNA-binding SOS-regulon protein
MHGGSEQIYLEAWRTGLPFFKLLKHQEKFAWTPEADQALAQLKDFLSKPPALTAPRKKEQLLLYLAATTHVVSTAIVVERQEDGHAYLVQRPVYNVAVAVLSKLGSTRAQVPAGVFVHEVHAPSIPEPAPPTTDPAHPRLARRSR